MDRPIGGQFYDPDLGKRDCKQDRIFVVAGPGSVEGSQCICRKDDIMKRRITSFVLAAAAALALFAMPASAASDKRIFPIAAMKEAVKESIVTVKETEDEGRDLSIAGPTATLVLEIEDNTNYIYQWEYLDDYGQWQLVGGANGTVYPVNDLKSGKTYTFRCVVTTRHCLELVPSRIINVTVE